MLVFVHHSFKTDKEPKPILKKENKENCTKGDVGHFLLR